MANLLKWNPYGTVVSLADATAMASRADGYYNTAQVAATDVVIDNSTNLNMMMDVLINLGAATWTTTGWLELYLLLAADGTNYDSGSSTYLPSSNNLVASLQISTDTTSAAKQITARGIILPPGKAKILWRTKAGVTLAASGSTMGYYTYTPNLNG
jgi:hypothetical protein